jgi:hypothetical protein
MNKEMVTYAKGRPPQRIREKDGNKEYEEWIFGAPPEDVDFVRFVGDEVVQVKTMKVDGEKIVRTQKEVQLEDPARAAAPGDASETANKNNTAPKPKPAGAPTLRRPGEPGNDDPSQGIPTRTPIYGPGGPGGTSPPGQSPPGGGPGL